MLKPNRPLLLLDLHEDDADADRWLEFCETVVIRAEADQNFLCSILWFDEACFKLDELGMLIDITACNSRM